MLLVLITLLVEQKNMNINKNNAETALQVNKDNGQEVSTNNGTCITLNVYTLDPTWHNIYHHGTKPKSVTGL
jgi:hypothetical protein